jgi:hypothetical protein
MYIRTQHGQYQTVYDAVRSMSGMSDSHAVASVLFWESASSQCRELTKQRLRIE